MSSSANTRAFTRDLLRWGRAHRRDFPWRTETDPFRILVAEILLQRSRGKTVASVYRALFDRWPDAEALATARVASIRNLIRPLGLTSRAETLRDLARAVVVAGEVSATVKGLLELPGVGPYTAHATLAIAFSQHVPTVDGVTARVYRRYLGLSAGLPVSSDSALWSLVKEVTPRSGVREWNWAVLDLASAICLPRRPRCSECPLEHRCCWSGSARALGVRGSA